MVGELACGGRIRPECSNRAATRSVLPDQAFPGGGRDLGVISSRLQMKQLEWVVGYHA